MGKKRGALTKDQSERRDATRAKNRAALGPTVPRRKTDGGKSYTPAAEGGYGDGDYTIAIRWRRYGAKLWEE